MKVQFNRLSNTLMMLLVLGTIFFGSCKHEIPTPKAQPTPCDPNTIYFSRDILPIFNSNCVNCHGDLNPADDIVLSSYQAVISSGVVVAGDPDDSKLYEAITDTDPDDIMPQPPNNPLTSSQISMIRKWIEQGAQNLVCDEENCDSTIVTWAGVISQIIQDNCKGCHSPPSPNGGYDLSTYTGVSAIALSGYLMGTVQHSSGYSPMPKNTAQLSACDIAKLRIWVAAGAPNN